MPLTPEEIAEANSLESAAQPKPLNPIKDLSAQELVDLTTKDPDNFDLVSEFQRNKDLWADSNLVQKVADAHNLVKQRGFQFSDLPGPKKLLKSGFDVVKGFGKQIWNYANAAGAAVAGQLVPGSEEEMNREAQRRVAESFSGTESAVTGLAEMGKRGIEKAGRGLGISKPLTQFTPEEKVKDLFDAVGAGETQEEILKGHGGFMQPVGGEVIKELEQKGMPVRPEETQALAAGDPFSWYLFGKALQPVEAAGKAVAGALPTIKGAKGLTGAVGESLEQTGKAIQQSGRAAEVVPKVATPVLPVAGAVIGGAKFGPAGILGGLAAGKQAAGGVGKVAAPIAAGAKKLGSSLESLGKQIAGSAPMKSAYAQIGKDILEATPGAVASTAKGAALDIGLAAATSETPQETGGVGLGTALGALGGAGRIGKRVISGQIIAPREFGATAAIPSSGQFPTLDAMHQSAFAGAEPGVKLRLNAIREFVKGAAPGTDVFLAKDAPSLESALVQSGVSPEQAKQWSQQEGIFTRDLPSKDGATRRVIIAKNVDSAPHESFHAIQDVIGEEGNRQIDDLVKKEYADQWDTEGNRYAHRLGIDLKTNTWEEGILDKSGWGIDAAKEKLIQTYGTPKAAADVLQMAVEGAKERNPQASEQQIWRDILTPEEAKAEADRYIARELAAENFDAVFKHGGPRLENQTLPGQLARLAAKIMVGLGIEPLAGRKTEIGQIEPKFRVAESVQQIGKVTPGETIVPKTSSTPTPPTAPLSPEGEILRNWIAKNPITVPDRARAASAIADAAEQGKAVQVIYYGAKGEPGGSIESERPERRAEIESQREAENKDRPLVRKTFTPERVEITGKGPQIIGWSPDNFFANANKLAEWASKTGVALPYEIADGKFTDAGWNSLQADLKTFMQNQRAGATGSGEALVVPKETLARGFTQPKAEGTPQALDQARADIINYLFGTKIPETTSRVAPLHIAGQEISAATAPGRVEIPVRPRGEYTEAQLLKAGIVEPKGVREVNPFRQQIENTAKQTGVPVPELIEVSQRLNLNRIADASVAPEVQPIRANTLTLAAGFQPREWRVQGVRNGTKDEQTFKADTENEARQMALANGLRPTSVSAAGENAALASGMFQPPKLSKEPEAIKIAAVRFPNGKIYTADESLTHGGALRKAFNAGEPRTEGYDVGFTTNAGEFLSRKAAFKRAKEFGQITGEEYTPRPGELESVMFEGAKAGPAIRMESQFQPKTAQEIEQMSSEDFQKWTQTLPGGFTKFAYDLGQGAADKGPEEVAKLRDSYSALQDQAAKLLQTDVQTAMTTSFKAQLFREAWEAATGLGSGGEMMRTLRAKSQAQPAKEDFKFPERSASGFKKAWILPDGTPVQLGGKWHHQWLAENKDVIGLDVPPFEGTDTAGVREKALQKGFVRVNYTVRSGSMNVEARAADWPNQKEAIRSMVEANAPDLDNIHISLTNEAGDKVIRSESAKLFELDDADKMSRIPLMENAEITPRKELGPAVEPEALRPPPVEEPSAVKGKAKSIEETLKNQAQPELFSDPEFESRLDEVRNGSRAGETFTPGGNSWRTGGKDYDIVTLASVNVPKKELTADRVRTELAPYSELLKTPGVVAGVFSFEKDGKPMVSIDLNAAVPQEHRENSVNFAKANNQISIWDASAAEEVKTGGTGETTLKTPEQINKILKPLLAGEPVDIETAIKSQAQPKAQEDLFGTEGEQHKRPLSSSELGGMTNQQIKEYYPESVIPKSREDRIQSKITESPLYKKAGDEDAAVNAFADKLVEFAHSRENDPAFKDGMEWYSDFTTKFKKEFGKDSQLMAEMLAATSPQTDVSMNFRYAFEAVESMKAGRFDKIISKFNEGLGMMEDGSWEKWINKEIKAGRVPDPPAKLTPATFMAHWVMTHNLKPIRPNGKLFGLHSTNVLRVFARRWLDMSVGPKTKNFVANLLGDSHEATIDLWADRTMRRIGYSDFQERWRILPKNLHPVSDKDFAFSQKAFRAAAEKYGVKPDALQGALWFAEKSLWAEKGWSALDYGDFRKEMEKIPALRKAMQSQTDETPPAITPDLITARKKK